MPSGKHIDHDDVHWYLWEQADSRRTVRIRSEDLQDHLGVNKFTVSRLLTRMVEQGRIRQVTKRKYLKGLFIVEDPETYVPVSNGETK